MNGRLLTWLAFGLLLGLLLGFAFGKADPRAPLFVGAVGALLGLVGSSAVSALNLLWRFDASRTNYLAICGALLGGVCGGLIGANSGLGRLMIAVFNPDLPEQDFRVFFGATGGIVLGAFFGACLVASIGLLFRHSKTQHREPD